ncbi:lamin tail domain-containing protein [Metabacillus litoralis]|uniref:lamin tail domain-containing protein n=1 Tax=Metabacillus litoralis TaxID=152268 RepID=UPI001CFD13AF|nr:lamin tail domain-containing protein [Metabacillus litoralis]
MSGRAVRRKCKKLFIFVSLVMIVFSNFISVLPMKKVSAVESLNQSNILSIEETKDNDKVDEDIESISEDSADQVEPEESVDANVSEEEMKEDPQEEAKIIETEKAEQQTENPQDTSKTPTTETETLPTPQEESTKETTPIQAEDPTNNVEEDFNRFSPILITEITPNSKGTDNYEYFELYNNTNQKLSLTNYSFVYHYTDGSKEDKVFQLPATVMEPQETLIFWYNPKNLSLTDFNNQFGTNLKSNQVIEFTDVFPGFANGGNRALIIKDKNNSELVSASYLGNEADNATGSGIDYKYPATGTMMDKLQVLASPTPGEIDAAQVPEKPVEQEEAPAEDTEAPVIDHTPVNESKAFSELNISAKVTDNMAVNPVSILYYKNQEEADFTAIPMVGNGEDASIVSATIPGSHVNSTITYYLEASDGINVAKTDEYSISVELPEETFSEQPLLITEISPNSAGGGTDYYEFFELYNNTTQPLALTNYSFIYKYTDSGKEVVFQVPPTTIEPQETLVFWFNNGTRTVEDFSTNFGSALTADQVIEFTDVFPGFANGGNRAIVIKDSMNSEVVFASYLGNENDNTGADIHYMFKATGTEMEKYQVLAAPNPGFILPVQVPTKPIELEETPKDTEAPVINHTPVTESDAFSTITIEADITDNMAVPFSTLYYKKAGEENFTSLSMNMSADSAKYSATIPGLDVEENMIYYIEAGDGTNTSTTDEFVITVTKDEVDYEKIPQFLVTEIVPDSTNVGSADGYEFIEVYNNTDQDMNFKEYKLQYRYGNDPASDVVWASVPDDVVIPSKETLVFWIINSQNGEKTVADFNANYGSNLVENQDIVRIYSDGMANGSPRGLVVATNTKEEITVSYYNDVVNVDDTVADKGIVYKYPENGSKQSVKISAGLLDATPGAVDANQVPKKPVHVIRDNVPPTFENKTNITEILQTEDIKISAAASDDVEVKSVRLFYRTNDQDVYNEALLTLDSETHLYENMIYASELIGKEYVEYFFTVSDGTNEVKSEINKIIIKSMNDTSDIRLNVKNKQVLSKTKVLKATSKEEEAKDVKLFVDNAELTEKTYHSLETEAYLALEVNGLNTYFQNAVTMGDDILFLMDKDWLSHWKTFTIPVEADRLQLGENILTVRAGNKASPFQLEEDEENRDDYNLRNVRLILADGTVLRDQDKSDPTKVYDMGDDGTFRPFEDFTFTITKEHTTSQTYAWNTTTVEDGEHIVKAQDSDQEISKTVLVDNTAPSVETTIIEGKEYKGSFTIDAAVTDEIAGVNTVKALLDGEQIQLPFNTASSQLEAGEHHLSILATDLAGNEAEKVVQFSVTNENPFKPELISPTDGSSTPVTGDPRLKVKVTDPSGDDLDVKYYQGFKYDTSNTNNVKAFKNSTDFEPPQTMVPEGEEAFTNEDRSAVSEKDGTYMITDSSEKFPYHRFDVQVDSSIDENDEIELTWSGNSLEGRKVSMYAWNHSEAKWQLITYKVAGAEDFELKGYVEVSNFVKNSNINVLIQDEIPSTPNEYDYTFVWMSDTQYYSESYPYIFERQTNWIAEKQEELKIKYVFHTGDLVDNFDQQQEWKYADEYMKVLDDNNVPYGVLAGNHDVNQLSNDYTEYYKRFGADRFEDKPYYGETYKNNRGHYDLISENGNDFIMVYMGWGIQDEDLEWIDDVLKQYPDRKAILSFHEYLLVSGNRSPLGNKIYEKVVEPNENVIAVLSGHYHDSETLISEIDDDNDGVTDRKVYQMLGDYQGGPEGGQGYMKLLHFDQDNNRIIVNTYSPYLDDYNYYDPSEYPGKDEMIIDLDLSVDEKRVATDYFAVNVKTDSEIGKKENVPSGSEAEVTWTGLTENGTYSWYAVAEDQYTGKSSSDIWTFTKGKDETTNPTDPGENPEQPGDGDNPGENPEQPGDGDNPGENPEQPGDGDNSGENPEQPGKGDNPTEDPELPGKGTNKPVKDVSTESEKIAVLLQAGTATISTGDLKQLSNNTKVILDLKKEYNFKVQLTKQQIQLLKQKQLVLSIQNQDMNVFIPAKNLPNGDVIISVERMKDIHGSVSAVYDFSITSGDKVYHEFPQNMILEFKVKEDVENSDKVKVYYYNEELKKWELVGGHYKNGVVTASTDHFSTFAAFEMTTDNDADKMDSPESGYHLPTTGTNMFTILLGGMILFVIGAGFSLNQRRKVI